MYFSKQITAWLAAFLLPSIASAQVSVFQPGYVVRATAPADTLRGYVDSFFAVQNKGEVRFRTVQADATTEQVFKATQLTAAGVGSQEAYVTRRILIGDSLQPRFLQVVILGPVSLYKTESNEQKAAYFVERQDGQAMPLRREQPLQVLQSVLAGCPGLSFANGSRHSYQLDDMRRAVRAYNQCAAPQQPEQVLSGPPRPGSQLGLRVGLQSSRLYFPNGIGSLPRQKPDAQLSPTAGIFWKINLNSRFALMPELRYGRSESSVSVVRRQGQSNDYYRVGTDLRASYVQLPLMLRYTFGRPGRLLRPYLEGGFVLGVVFNTTVEYSLTTMGTVGGDKTITDQYPIDRTLRGYSGGAGLDFYSSIGVWGFSARLDALSLNNSNLNLAHLYADNQALTLTYSWH